MVDGTTFDVLIVGAGHGGAAVAIALRQRGFTGSVAMVGDEVDLPYERPPLSKGYLAGKTTFDRLLIRPASFWGERGVDFYGGCVIASVDAVAHTVCTASGATFGYGTLIWAGGGSPRRLSCPGHDLSGVHSVRNRADVDRMIAQLPAVDRVAVIGGGYIGLEAAAVLTKLGKSVTVLEALDRVLARVAGEPLSRFYEAEHRAEGVDLRTRTEVTCIEGRGGGACGVRLADGTVIDCDMVIVGIGIVPAVEPLRNAGAIGANGVSVDEFCRTSLPDIYAVGDCAAHCNGFAGGALIRLESVQNANDQAAVVASDLTGTPIPYASVPWFWSDQYDLRLQTVGLSTGHDQTVIRGEPRTRSFSLIYLREGIVISLDCVNAARDYVQGRGLVTSRTVASQRTLADVSQPLKSLLAGRAAT